MHFNLKRFSPRKCLQCVCNHRITIPHCFWSFNISPHFAILLANGHFDDGLSRSTMPYCYGTNKGNYHFNDLSSSCPSLVRAFHHGGFVLRDWPSVKNPYMVFPNRPYVFKDDGSVSGVVNSCDSLYLLLFCRSYSLTLEPSDRLGLRIPMIAFHRQLKYESIPFIVLSFQSQLSLMNPNTLFFL